MSTSESLMPGPEGKTPRFYEVDRGQKTESYITAVAGNPVLSPPPIQPVVFKKDHDKIELVPKKLPKAYSGIGLSEEELKEYRDSRCWKLLRLFLFVLFWLLWLFMFSLAILLVFLSPGCAVKHEPHWWQTTVVYNLWVPSFQDSDGDGVGDVPGLISRLENLRRSGIQTIWPVPFLISDNMGSAVRNFRQLDPKFGVNQKADELIRKVHDADMKIVLSIPIATTSLEHEWFLSSSSASLPQNKNYSEFYYWSADDTNKGDFWSNYKTLFYLHEKENHQAAVLNWKHTAVRTHMFDVLSQWIDRGVDGFHLSGIEYLARTPDGTEPDWQAISDTIRDIRNHVDTYAAESVKLDTEKKEISLFASREEAKEKDKKQLSNTGLDSIINYELGRVEKDTDICHKSEGTIATCVHEILSDVLLFHTMNEDVWPQWEFGNPRLSRVASRVGSRVHAELITMLQLVLPGTNNIYYGDEIGMRDLANDSVTAPQLGAMQWDDTISGGFSTKESVSTPVNSDYLNINWVRQYAEERSHLKMFSKLAKLRGRDETLMVGKTLVGRLVDGAFVVTRFLQTHNVTKGHIYVAVLNFAPHPVTLPLMDLPSKEKMVKSQIITTTSNVERFHARQFVDFSSESVTLQDEQGIVFRYIA